MPRPAEETDAAVVQKVEEAKVSAASPRPPVPLVMVTGEGSHEDHGGSFDDRVSDSGSTYEGSIYGNGHAHSVEDLTCRGHVHLHLKYFLRRNLLEVTVTSVRDLVSKHDSKDKTNPFVRLYLLPGNVSDCASIATLLITCLIFAVVFILYHFVIHQ